MTFEDQKDVDRVLDFWFSQTSPQQRFSKDVKFDRKIRQKFETLYWQIVHGERDNWKQTPRGLLAMIIVLDQFARNMFRAKAQSFAADEQALSLSRQALQNGADQEVHKQWRQYFYMPFMHSESAAVHEEALALFREKTNEEILKYEISHKEIIDQFGRYPHRNSVLGRASTPQELEFLAQHTGF